ncbi:MAG: hypothetical protein FJ044_04865 [Candidatus Cloacimonetes bacterium]|nr:hypothetical protein [Candidatus Cloacimonadota bacterium]
MEKVDKILKQKKDKPGYIKHEFQDYGYRLAQELNDLKHKALYIKLAKQEKRELLEKARIFAADYYGAKSKAKIFMWKLRKIKNERVKSKDKENG